MATLSRGPGFSVRMFVRPRDLPCVPGVGAAQARKGRRPNRRARPWAWWSGGEADDRAAPPGDGNDEFDKFGSLSF